MPTRYRAWPSMMTGTVLPRTSRPVAGPTNRSETTGFPVSSARAIIGLLASRGSAAPKGRMVLISCWPVGSWTTMLLPTWLGSSVCASV